MNTSSTRAARLNRRARILLAIGGAVLVIVLVAVALLAFDRPLLARLSRNLPGAATFQACSPGGNCPDSCTNQKPPTRCGSSCTLQNGGVCEGIDLTYVQSSGQLVLEDSDLEGCKLGGSTLSGSLFGAHLKGATFVDAILAGADLAAADLSFTELYGADLRGADLSFATLRGADLTDANLTGAVAILSLGWDNVYFCRTTMPDGAVNNSNCP